MQVSCRSGLARCGEAHRSQGQGPQSLITELRLISALTKKKNPEAAPGSTTPAPTSLNVSLASAQFPLEQGPFLTMLMAYHRAEASPSEILKPKLHNYSFT